MPMKEYKSNMDPANGVLAFVDQNLGPPDGSPQAPILTASCITIIPHHVQYTWGRYSKIRKTRWDSNEERGRNQAAHYAKAMRRPTNADGKPLINYNGKYFDSTVLHEVGYTVRLQAYHYC